MEIEWTPRAIRDVRAQILYYADFNAFAAARMADEIRKQHQLLSELPGIGRPGLKQHTRELVISGTPFVLIYRVTDRVTILRLFHGAQDWPGRY